MFLLFGFTWFAGWVLGIIGFFSALSAHRELRRLRVMLAAGRERPDAALPIGSLPPPLAEPGAATVPLAGHERVAGTILSAEPEPAAGMMPPAGPEPVAAATPPASPPPSD